MQACLAFIRNELNSMCKFLISSSSVQKDHSNSQNNCLQMTQCVCHSAQGGSKHKRASGALLEFPVITAMNWKSRVSSAISVCDN